MLDILETHLNNTETSAYVQTISEAHELFDKLNYAGYEAEFVELLNAFDQLENPTGEITDLTKNLQIGLLRQFGIFINEESELCTVEFLNKILSAITLLESTELIDEIELAALSIDDKKECVCVILNVVDKTIFVEDCMVVIDTVVHSLIDRIIEVASGNLDKNSAPLNNGISPGEREYILACSAEIGPTNIFEYAKAYNVTLSFDVYAGILDELLPEKKENINIPAYAKELLMIAVLSGKDNRNYPQAIRAYLSENSELSISAHTELLVEIDKLFTPITKVNTSVK